MFATLLFAGFGERSNSNRAQTRAASVAIDLLVFERKAANLPQSAVHALREGSWLSPRTDTYNFLNISHDGFRRRAGSSPLIRARASSPRQ